MSAEKEKEKKKPQRQHGSLAVSPLVPRSAAQLRLIDHGRAPCHSHAAAARASAARRAAPSLLDSTVGDGREPSWRGGDGGDDDACAMEPEQSCVSRRCIVPSGPGERRDVGAGASDRNRAGGRSEEMGPRPPELVSRMVRREASMRAIQKRGSVASHEGEERFLRAVSDMLDSGLVW